MFVVNLMVLPVWCGSVIRGLQGISGADRALSVPEKSPKNRKTELKKELAGRHLSKEDEVTGVIR